jgi:hypothetical protein
MLCNAWLYCGLLVVRSHFHAGVTQSIKQIYFSMSDIGTQCALDMNSHTVHQETSDCHSLWVEGLFHFENLASQALSIYFRQIQAAMEPHWTLLVGPKQESKPRKRDNNADQQMSWLARSLISWIGVVTVEESVVLPGSVGRWVVERRLKNC